VGYLAVPVTTAPVGMVGAWAIDGSNQFGSSGAYSMAVVKFTLTGTGDIQYRNWKFNGTPVLAVVDGTSHAIDTFGAAGALHNTYYSGSLVDGSYELTSIGSTTFVPYLIPNTPLAAGTHEVLIYSPVQTFNMFPDATLHIYDSGGTPVLLSPTVIGYVPFGQCVMMSTTPTVAGANITTGAVAYEGHDWVASGGISGMPAQSYPTAFNPVPGTCCHNLRIKVKAGSTHLSLLMSAAQSGVVAIWKNGAPAPITGNTNGSQYILPGGGTGPNGFPMDVYDCCAVTGGDIIDIVHCDGAGFSLSGICIAGTGGGLDQSTDRRRPMICVYTDSTGANNPSTPINQTYVQNGGLQQPGDRGWAWNLAQLMGRGLCNFSYGGAAVIHYDQHAGAWYAPTMGAFIATWNAANPNQLIDTGATSYFTNDWAGYPNGPPTPNYYYNAAYGNCGNYAGFIALAVTEYQSMVTSLLTNGPASGIKWWFFPPSPRVSSNGDNNGRAGFPTGATITPAYWHTIFTSVIQPAVAAFVAANPSYASMVQAADTEAVGDGHPSILNVPVSGYYADYTYPNNDTDLVDVTNTGAGTDGLHMYAAPNQGTPPPANPRSGTRVAQRMLLAMSPPANPISFPDFSGGMQQLTGGLDG